MRSAIVMDSTPDITDTNPSRGPGHRPAAVDAQPVPASALDGVAAIADVPVQRGLARLRGLAGELAACGERLPFDPDDVEELVLPGLRDSLVTLLVQPVVLELHVARLQGRLTGDTPQERFRAFVARLAEEVESAELMQEYP